MTLNEYIAKVVSNPRFKAWGGRKVLPANKKQKYGAKKCTWNGMAFDSKKELARYQQLLLMEKAGVISDLHRQVEFELIPKQGKERAVFYIADFVYRQGAETVVEDAKGVRTRDYVIKRKLMLERYGIEIKEV